MITYTDSLDGITADGLRGGFFDGWGSPPTPETHLQILRGSFAVVLALDGDRVVGFITAVSDGVSAAYLPHLEVLPAYRGQGIGTALARQMLEKLNHLYMIDLICDADLQPFYERLGLRRYTAMIRRNYAAQSGTFELAD
ncbi:N-acetylglutamate synthase [Anaerolineae bacterium]|nr:N-acetylglutamate synthase [Anaerolineae bacterium]